MGEKKGRTKENENLLTSNRSQRSTSKSCILISVGVEVALLNIRCYVMDIKKKQANSHKGLFYIYIQRHSNIYKQSTLRKTQKLHNLNLNHF